MAGYPPLMNATRPTIDINSYLELPSRNNCRGISSKHSDRELKIRSYLGRVREAIKTGTIEEQDRLHGPLMCSRDFLVMQSCTSDSPTFLPFACGKKFCPTCVRTWSAELTARALPAARAIPAGELRHMVLTVPNPPFGHLKDWLDVLFNAWRRWRDAGRRIDRGGWMANVQGYAYKLEIDINLTRRRRKSSSGGSYMAEPSWHPHLHVLLHAPKGFDFGRDSKARAKWCDLTGAFPHAQYITRPKNGAIALEVCKYAAKPLQLEHLPVERLKEIAVAIHKRRFTTSQGTLQYEAPDTGDKGYQYIGKLSDLYAMMAQPGEAGDDAWYLVESFVRKHLNDDVVFQRMPSLITLRESIRDQEKET